MKYFHAHIAVKDVDASVDFYSKLFGQPPTKRQDDYAKWILEDPRVNFAISGRGPVAGVNHFGFQVDSVEALAEMKKLAEAASPGGVSDQEISACCYSNSEKHWTLDPQGLAWEHFYTMSDALEFSSHVDDQVSGCCIPIRGSDINAPSAEGVCCIPNGSSETQGACCG